MALNSNLEPFFNQEVTIAPYSNEDQFGSITHGTAVTFKAKIEHATVNIRTDFDREVRSDRKIFLFTQITTIDTRDKLTLPAAFAPINPLIMAVRVVLDRDGISHIVLLTE